MHRSDHGAGSEEIFFEPFGFHETFALQESVYRTKVSLSKSMFRQFSDVV